jgi:Stress responsive A/B Barrel Domain
MQRKSFLKAVAMGTMGILAPKFSQNMPEKNLFVHHVYFWLKNPGSKEDYNKLLEGLQALSKVSTIKMCHIGKPADTNRDVIDRSYAVSWLLLFKNKEDQDKYQVDPIHLKFVEQYSHLWSKVTVYDSVDV